MSMIFKTPIAVEGKLTSDGRLLLPGALKWENLPLPVVRATYPGVQVDFPMIVGMLLSAERREGGFIEGEIELREELSGSYAAAITVDFVEEEVDEVSTSLVLKSARLRQVALNSPENAAWPEAVFEVPHE